MMIDLAKEWSDAELKALPPIVLDHGTADETGVTRNKHLRNPFCPDGRAVADEPRATLANRWSELNWAGDTDDDHDIDIDPFDALREALNSQSLWHEFRGDDGALTVFPSAPNYAQGSEVQRVADASFEKHCLDMHDGQTGITLADKPVPDFADHKRELRRGN